MLMSVPPTLMTAPAMALLDAPLPAQTQTVDTYVIVQMGLYWVLTDGNVSVSFDATSHLPSDSP